MRNNIALNIIKVILFLFITSNSFAQIDLSFGSSTTVAVSVPQGGNTPLDVQFQVLNTGNLDAADGVTLNIVFDTALFTLNSVPPAPWGCSADANGLICDYFGSLVATTGNELLPLQFIVGAAAQPNSYPFSANLVDVSGTEVFTSNNNAGFNVTIAAVAIPDLALVAGITPLNFNFTESDLSPQSVSYRIINNGGDATLGVDFAVSYDDLNFSLSGPTSATPAGWNCAPSAGVVICSTGSVFVANATADFTFDFSLLPNTILGNYTNSLVGSLQDPSFTETNFLDNDLISTASVATAGGPDLDFIDAATLTTYDATEGQAALVNIDFQVTNLGTDTFGGTGDSYFEFPHDLNIVFKEPSSTLNLWNCFASTPTIVRCETFDSIINGQVLNFSLAFDVSAASIANYPIQGTITTLSGDVDTLNNTINTNINVSSAVIETDLLLRKFVKDGVGGSLINGTTIPFDSIYYYSIQVDNISGFAADSVKVTDDLPIGVEIIGFSSVFNDWSCSWTGFNITSSQQVTCTIPNIAANVVGNTNYIYLQVQARSSGNKFNNASVSSITTDLDVFNNSNNPTNSDITIDVAPPADVNMTITKDIILGAVIGDLGVLEAQQGTQVVYKILVDNTTAGVNANNVVITDVLPMGVDLDFPNGINALGNFQTAMGGSCAYDIGLRKLTCTATAIPKTVDFDGVEIAVTVAGNLNDVVAINTATVSADNNLIDSSASSESFTIVSASLPSVDIDMTKDALDFANTVITSINVGDSFKYKLVVANYGNNDAPIGSVLVQDTLPPEVSFVLPFNNPPNWTCNIVANQLFCENDIIMAASGGILIIEIPVVADVAGIGVVNTAVANITTPPVVVDTSILNDSDSANINIVAATTDLTFTKTVIGGTVANKKGGKQVRGVNPNFAIGDTVIYSLLVQNSSAFSSISDLVIQDPLDTNFLSFSSFNIIQSSANFTCTYDGVATVNCDNTSGTPFLPGDNFEVEIQATATAAGINISNVGFLSSATLGTNMATSPVLIDIDSGLLPTSLTVDKQALFNGLPVLSLSKGSTFIYRVNIINSGTEIANNLQLTDDMPTGITVNNSNGTGWICSNVGQLYTCDLPGQLAPGAATFVDFEVTDNSTAAVLQLQNNVNVTADNAPFQVASNSLNLTSANLTVNITQNPNPVVENSNFEIIVDVINTGTEQLETIQVVNTLPTGFSYNSTNTKASNCTQSGSVMTCMVTAPIGIGATEIITMPVTAIAVVDTNTIYTNTTVVSGSNLASSVTTQTTMNVSATGAPQGDISIVKSASVTEVNTDGLFQYTLDVSNIGSSDVTDVKVIDNLPVGVVVDSVSATNWSCTGTTQVVCTQPLMTAGSTSTIVINVFAPATAGDILNSAQVSMTEVDTNSANNSSQVSVIVNSVTKPINDISISKTASVAEISVTGSYQYTLTVFNNGTEVATGLSVTDMLPSGVQLDSIDAPDWSCSGTNQIECTLSSLNASSSTNIILHVVAPDTVGTVNNVASVSLNETDSNPANNSSNVSVNVISVGTATTDLKVTKTASVSELNSGEQLTWTIDVLNNGPDSAENVVLTDVLPTGFDLLTAQTSKGTCTNNKGTVQCSITTIDNQETAIITLIGTATLSSGVLDNLASVTTDSEDIDSSNDSDMASVMVNAIQVQDADVSVSISTSEDINQGETATFDILTKNNGPNNASSPTLNIAVVGILESVSISETSDWTCQISGFNIDCQFNNELMSMGYQSTLSLVVETTKVVMQEQDVVVNATITTSSNDPDMSNNVASTQISVVGTPSQGEILSAMQTALNGAGSQQVNQAIENVSSYCERKYFNALEGLCADLYGAALSGDGETIKKVMEEITPSEVIGQSSSVAEISSAQFRNVGARLSALRGGGGGGFSSAGLNARYGSGSIPLGMLAYLNQTEDKTDGITNTANDFISPWGFFVNGSISMGKRDATGTELGFDFDTFGLTAGFDYRLDAKKVVGIAVGYASFDSKIEDSAKLESTGVTLTGYGSFYVNDNFYVDTRISYGKPKFNQSRDIDFAVGAVQVQRTAQGETDANQYSVAMSVGYNFNKNSWVITPNASISYVNTTINGFTETGAGDFNFRFGEQIIESMVWSTGINMAKAISLKKGVITPQFDFNYNYESLNDSNDIRAWFVKAPDDEVFIIKTDSPDRTYGSAGLGFVYISSNGKQAYINYRSILGLEGFSRGTFNLGARFEF